MYRQCEHCVAEGGRVGGRWLVLQSQTHLLPAQPGSPPVPVTLTDVDEDGVISIQLMGPGVNRLQQLMNEINDAYSKVTADCDCAIVFVFVFRIVIFIFLLLR